MNSFALMRSFLLIAYLLICPEIMISLAQPVASFNPSRFKICSATSVDLINTSTGANEFTWYIDGSFYSSAPDTSVVLIESCYDHKTIKLLACDTSSGTCDSSSVSVEVFDSCYFHLTGDFFRCPGDTVTLQAGPEAISTTWNVQPAVTFFNGCDTCSNISFILTQQGTMVDRRNTYLGGCTDLSSFHYLCMISGIDEEEIFFSVYPNPFTDHITIHASQDFLLESIQLFSALGEIVPFHTLNGNSMDLRDLSNGLYYLKIKFRSRIRTQEKGLVILKN